MHNVLVITTGGTPQLVTETVYGLIRPDNGAPWFPDRIVLATTTEGAAIYSGIEVRGTEYPPLFVPNERRGKLYDMYAQLGLSDRFVEPEVRVASDGVASISDVRTPLEVETYAQMLLDLVFDITGDEQSTLHLSIAGGRKTMSFIAGQVMSICGRPQDVMSHCLISPPEFENRRDFWWPGNEGDLSTQEAHVDLHQVPFVKLASHINVRQVFEHKADSYAEAVARTNLTLDSERLVLDFTNRTISVATLRVELQSARFSAIAVIAVAAKLGLVLSKRMGSDHLVGELDADSDYFAFVWAACRAICDIPLLQAQIKEGTDLRVAFEGNLDIEFQAFNEHVSHARRALKEEFPDRTVDAIVWRVRGKEIKTRFDASKIDVILPADCDFSLFSKRDKGFLIGL